MDKTKQRSKEVNTWDEGVCNGLIEQLWALRQSMRECEAVLAHRLAGIHPDYQASARNLAHYLALRQVDRRPLQESLARLGVSSLGRAESNVLANVDKVLGILHRLVGQPWQAHSEDEPVGILSSGKLLERHTLDLLGPIPKDRAVRIMVTLPAEAAVDFGLVRQLLDSGMDIARINCAHDGPGEWQAMAEHVRRAAKAVGRPVRILMDLGGAEITYRPGCSCSRRVQAAAGAGRMRPAAGRRAHRPQADRGNPAGGRGGAASRGGCGLAGRS